MIAPSTYAIRARRCLRPLQGTGHHQCLAPFGPGAILGAKPCIRATRKVDIVVRQAVDHDHEHVGSNGSKYVPPTMELQHEAPGHANGAFPGCQLRAVNEIEIPKKIPKEEGCCEAVSVVFTSDQSMTRPSIPVPKIESHLSIRLSSTLAILWLINALV